MDDYTAEQWQAELDFIEGVCADADCLEWDEAHRGLDLDADVDAD